MVAGAAAAAGAVGEAVAVGGLGLELPTGGGEDCLTLYLKPFPSRIFTMVGLEKERRWR